MNFGHFSTQNTSVKVEISNQVKCHTAQRSEARGGRAGPEAGRKMSRPRRPSTPVAARAGGGGASLGGGRLRVTARGAKSYSLQGEALGERVEKPGHQRIQTRTPGDGGRPTRARRGAPLGPATLPAGRARKGLVALSCLVSPPAPFCNPIPALRSQGSRRPARRPALPRPAL